MIPTAFESPRLICISGGIGSGKSVVSHFLTAMGFPVYDCDSRAAALMNTDAEIHRMLNELIDPKVVVDGVIDRKRLSDIVFSDAEKLEILNGIVHRKVRENLAQWFEEHVSSGMNLCFVESAIPVESHLDRVVDAFWDVYAPREVRIQRVMKRNSLSSAQVECRMNSQIELNEENLERRLPVLKIINDDVTAVTPQILAALSDLGSALR